MADPRATPAEIPGGPAARLDAARRDGVAAFEAVVDELRSVRGAASDLTETLDRLGACCRSAASADADVATLVARIAALETAGAAGLARLGDGAASRGLAAARVSLGQLKQDSSGFWSLACLTAVSAGSLGTTAFDRHVRLVRDLSGKLAQNCDSALTQLNLVEGALGEMRGAVQNGTDVAAGLRRGLAAALTGAGEGRTLDALGQRFSASATDLTARAREGLRDLVSCLQFSDAFSQRLEHVIAILQITQLPPADRAALVAAQLDALAADQQATRASIARALAGLSETARTARRSFAEGMGPTARSAIEMRRGMIGHAADAGARIEREVRAAEAVIEETGAAFEAASREFHALRATVKQISLSASNVTLLVQNKDSDFAPLIVLAREAWQMGSRTSSVIAAFETQIGAVAGVFDSAPFAPLSDAVAAFGVQRDACAATQAEIELIDATRLEAGSRADRLRQAVDKANAAMESIDRSLAQLDWHRDALSAPPPAASEPSEARAALLNVYTMEREREVHRALFPEDGPQPSGAAEEEDAMDGLEMF
ncbi:hypothetical protein [Jannaschia formosa]|uniref:hypothetical protein n=1 Tax=Jannaschia formosa TaxID=2259592 RepID=UPI000E1B9F08|nr:hypothetical protein [Jannaschia formosa]TFL17932.1 hypothetical protein DR046_12265 [Jannaschia formosa]